MTFYDWFLHDTIIEFIKKRPPCKVKNFVRACKSWLHKNINEIYTNSDQFGSYTFLQWAIRYKNEAAVKILLHNGADPNKVTYFNTSPLTISMEIRHYPITKLLLEYKADPNTDYIPSRFIKPLMHAAHITDTKFIKILLDYKADINMVCSATYETPLTVAAKYGEYNNVKLLVERTANINLTTGYEDGSLINAIRKNDIKIVKYLVDHGADINVTNNWRLGILSGETIDYISNIDELVNDHNKFITNHNNTQYNSLIYALEFIMPRILEFTDLVNFILEFCDILPYQDVELFGKPQLKNISEYRFDSNIILNDDDFDYDSDFSLSMMEF